MVTMEKELIEQVVKDIIVEVGFATEDQITLESKFVDDLGMDSLDGMEVCMTVEREFNVETSNEEFRKMKTVGSVVDYLDSVVNPVGI